MNSFNLFHPPTENKPCKQLQEMFLPKKKARKNSIVSRVKSFFESIINAPISLFHKLCFWVGFSVVSAVSVIVGAVLIFIYMSPSIGSMTFEDIKKIAESKIPKTAKHSWVSIDDISRHYLYAIVVSEDGQFFQHNGVNYDSILNSIAVNIKKRSFAVGASTISQQVVKNLFLTREKSIVRKLSELYLTNRLEKRFSKNQILEIYLNLIEVGPDMYGVNIAAKHYFAKKPKNINAAEGAFISLMLPSPRRHHLSIFSNKHLAPKHKRKLKRIFSDMQYFEYISPDQYSEYLTYQYFK